MPSQLRGPVHFRVYGQYQSCPFPMKTFKKTLSTFQISDMIWNYLQIWLLLLLNTNVIVCQSKTILQCLSVRSSLLEGATVYSEATSQASLADRTIFGLILFFLSSLLFFFFWERQVSMIHTLRHHLISFHWIKISWEAAVYF